MKQILSMILAAMPALMAQTAPAIRVTVPFEFTAGAKTFAPGTYLLQPGSGLRVVNIVNQQSKSSDMLMSVTADRYGAPSQSEVVFHRVGTRYFLNRVAITGQRAASELPATVEEREKSKHDRAEDIRLVAER